MQIWIEEKKGEGIVGGLVYWMIEGRNEGRIL